MLARRVTGARSYHRVGMTAPRRLAAELELVRRATMKVQYTDTSMPPRPTAVIKPVHLYAWLWEPLETEPSFVLRPMFGAKAVYLGGRLVLCFSARTEPWRGLLVCTERQHH